MDCSHDGKAEERGQLFNYAVNLEKRVGSDHPLRVAAAVVTSNLCGKKWRLALK